jgi:hypothetical protein
MGRLTKLANLLDNWLIYWLGTGFLAYILCQIFIFLYLTIFDIIKEMDAMRTFPNVYKPIQQSSGFLNVPEDYRSF